MGPFSRQEILLGPEGMKRLAQASVAVFGIGGVGSYVVEALARSGVGRLLLISCNHKELSFTCAEGSLNSCWHLCTQPHVTSEVMFLLDCACI